MGYGMTHFAGSAGAHPGVWLPNPLALATWLALDRQGNLSPLVTSGRTTTGTFFDATGTLQMAAIRVPRVSYDPAALSIGPFLLAEEARTNSIRNNTGQGAVVGGALPDFWTNSNTAGLSREVVGVVQIGAARFIDLRVFGTTNAASWTLQWNNLTDTPAALGQTWSLALYYALLSAVTGAPTAAWLDNRELNSSSSQISSGAVAIDLPTAELKRQIATRQTSMADVAFVSPRLRLTFTVGQEVDITLRIGLPELSQGMIQPWSPPILTYGTAVTRGADSLSVTNLAATGFNAAEGTLYVDMQMYESAHNAFRWPVNLATASSKNHIGFTNPTNGNAMRFAVTTDGVSQALLQSSVGFGSRIKAAGRYKTDDFAASVNGSAPLKDTSGTVPTGVNSLAIGTFISGQAIAASNSTRYFQIALLPAIPDSALQRLTRI